MRGKAHGNIDTKFRTICVTEYHLVDPNSLYTIIAVPTYEDIRHEREGTWQYGHEVEHYLCNGVHPSDSLTLYTMVAVPTYEDVGHEEGGTWQYGHEV